MKSKKINCGKNGVGKIGASVILGCIIGVAIGIYGWHMNVSPLYVGLFSGATTGCCIVILIENKHLDFLKSRGRKK